MRYPFFKVERTQPVFRDRSCLLAYERALQLAAAVDAALEVSLLSSTFTL